MSKSDTVFFKQIIEHAVIRKTLAQYGFLPPRTYEPEDGVRNAGLKFEKRDWFLPATGDRVERVCVHYESVRPGHFCIHVEIDPYEKGKSIKENDVRLITLVSELQSKAKLLGSIRTCIMADSRIKNEVCASTSRLEATERPNTNAAVKFEKLGIDCTPGECAEFFAEVIATVTPIVDSIIAEHHSHRG